MADDKLTVEKMAEELNGKFDSLKSSIDEKADLAGLEEKFGDLTGKFDDFAEKYADKTDLTKQQEQLDEISTSLKQLSELQGKNAKSWKQELREKMFSDEHKEKVKNFNDKRRIDYTIKAADIDTDDINSGTIETQTDVGVAKAPWRNTPIWDNINKGIVGQGRDSISWWEETSRTDSAEMVDENDAPASGSAKTWTKQSMDIKMIKDYTKVSKSALEDFEYINSEVQDLISNGIPRLRETQLLEGTGATVYLKGITQYAKTFAKPSNMNTVANANEGDVLAGAILQIMNGNTSDSGKKGFIPNIIALNPGDSVNMRLLKDANENYLRHPLMADDGRSFRGIQIIESLDLDAGQFLIGDFSRAKAYIKRNMNISFHYENEDDVLKDLVLVLASMRIAGLKVAASDEYAFVTSTFAASKSLIEKVVG